MTLMYDQIAVSLGVGNAEFKTVTDQSARVADLATRFGIERRAVEHDLDWTITADLGQLIEQMILRDDAANFGRRLRRFIAEELSDLQCLLERFDGTGLEQRGIGWS